MNSTKWTACTEELPPKDGKPFLLASYSEWSAANGSDPWDFEVVQWEAALKAYWGEEVSTSIEGWEKFYWWAPIEPPER
jgi:hypothetical protein